MTDDFQDLELQLLMDAVKARYGYEFAHYARASMMRRIRKHMEAAKTDRISDLIPLFIHNKAAFAHFVKDMSVTVTEMFRDPDFFQALRKSIVPLLKTFPFIKIWHAGCATGQEAYSMAIMLDEENLLERCQIYATDFNENSLKIARSGIYPDADLALYQENYSKSGGCKSLDQYCSRGYDSIKFNGRLTEHITFANHNLVSDGVFGEMNLILCRNVLIYFNNELQDRVLKLLIDSLRSRGILCLGRRENIRFSEAAGLLETVDRHQRIFRKKA
ncbi:chemotaxis protein CheR [Endozoicomonas montiporae]|uniref:Chemotaxis protein CheR n=2 Tax=Endozoicomonas montiporae TaxID=1027273 RepID=A0A081N924_9GAMM|nr:protein-glutamate O-methyltransferase CheR [Endozoicomonas montiporae]AMO55120.1 CheR-type protein glutamate methyltransferase [Endozoicomonas montiporae CL-33]KEQ14947.1 chemotaxis protein CheR [Endozoicomonas montiporae]